MRWYIVSDNKEHGPFSVDQLRALFSQNKIDSSHKARREGTQNLIAAHQLKALLAKELGGTGQQPDLHVVPTKTVERNQLPPVASVAPSRPQVRKSNSAAWGCGCATLFVVLFVSLTFLFFVGKAAKEAKEAREVVPTKLIGEQLVELNHKIDEWKSLRSKISERITSLGQDRTSLVFQLRQMGASASDQKSSDPKVSILLHELRDVLKQNLAFEKKLSDFELAIFKSESRVRTIERRIAAQDLAGTDNELAELVRSMMEMDVNLEAESKDEVPIELDDLLKKTLESSTGSSSSASSSPPPVSKNTQRQSNENFPIVDAPKSSTNEEKKTFPERRNTASPANASHRIITEGLGYVGHIELHLGKLYAGTNNKRVICIDLFSRNGEIVWSDSSLGNRVVALRVSDSGSLAAATYGKVVMYDCSNGKIKSAANLPLWNGFQFGSMAISPDLSNGIISGSGKVIQFDTKTGGQLKKEDAYIPKMVFSGDGKSIFVGCNEGGNPIEQKLISNRNTLTKFHGIRDRCFGLDVSSDSKFLIATGGVAKADQGSPKYQTILYDLKSGKKLFDLSGGDRCWNHTARFSKDGNFVATGGGGNPSDWYGHNSATVNDIVIWRTKDGSIAQRLKGHKAAVLDLEFNPSNTNLYSGSADGTIREWALELDR